MPHRLQAVRVSVPEQTLLIGTKEVATILQIHERTALRLMQRGIIKAFQLSTENTNRGVWRTLRSHVHAYIEHQINGCTLRYGSCSQQCPGGCFSDRPRRAESAAEAGDPSQTLPDR